MRQPGEGGQGLVGGGATGWASGSGALQLVLPKGNALSSTTAFALLVISSEQHQASEPEVLPQLFAAGLTTFHLRKPGWSQGELEAYLRAIPARYHPRIVLHAHYELALQYPLKGIHLTTQSRQQPGLPRLLRLLRGRSISASLHSLAEVVQHRRPYDYIFLSPIFDSTSKAGYGSRFHLPDVQQVLAACQLRRGYRPRVLALGGITPATIGLAQQVGFAGAAVLGGIWQQPDPVAAFENLCAQIR